MPRHYVKHANVLNYECHALVSLSIGGRSSSRVITRSGARRGPDAHARNGHEQLAIRHRLGPKVRPPHPHRAHGR